MVLTVEQLREIASEQQIGMQVFINIKSGEIVSLPDPDKLPSVEDGIWKDQRKKIKSNKEDYFEFESMGSRESYQIMEDFAGQVDDQKLREKLLDALNRPKPFSQFKWVIDNSGEYRQKWFEFRDARHVEWVRQIEAVRNEKNKSE
jgi:hypothetical protein